MSEEREFKTYDGVDFFEEDGERWFLIRDVRRMLGIDFGQEFGLPDDETMTALHYGILEDFVSSAGLDTLVDRSVGEDLESPHDLWRQAWHEDLAFYAEFGETTEEVKSGPLCDYLFDLVDGFAKGERERARDRVHDAIARLNEAVERLEEADSYLEGFGHALLITGHGNAHVSPMYTPINAVTFANASVNDAMNFLESIVDGDDDDQ